ncbi:hypothetical protein Leryth_016785 [Lithospermum erythrorhizon]|nr:hypothetical protein Leryth_016785 [Lithospermum erythrorhizon]
MLNATKLILKSNLRRGFSSTSRLIDDEGDWRYSSEWWTRKEDSRTVFSQVSDKGNGVVSVVSHPSSKPDIVYWGRMEEWLKQRYTHFYPGERRNERFRVAGYQWRTLHFGDDTRESTAKVMFAYKESDPDSLYLMQQAHCLAVPYVKSMISTGLTTLAYCNFDLQSAILGVKKMKVLCIGHGGGSIPLFLASKFLGAEVHTVDIDPAVVSASIQAMGFPSVSIVKTSGKHVCSQQHLFDGLFWKGVRERLTLYELDAEEFILEYNNLYDIVFIDAYDGYDIYPRNLWDPSFPFLKALSKKVCLRNSQCI